MSADLDSPLSQPKEAPMRRAKRARWQKVREFVGNPRAAVGVGIFGLFVLIAIFAPLIAPYNPQATNFIPNQPPSAANWLGTTATGQDVFSQFIFGTRTSLTVGVGAGLLATFLSLAIGVYAGYRGGVIDSILTAVTNIFLVLPTLALLIVMESYLRNTTPITNGFIIGLTGWAWGARVFRSQTMSLISRDFVVAARLSGMSSVRIMMTEIIPNMLSIVASNIMYACLGAILAEAGLAFLGFENLSSSSWGTMLYWADAGGAMLNGAWWWFLPPGLAIALVGTSFALMNSSVDQITNPRLRAARRRKPHGANSAGA